MVDPAPQKGVTEMDNPPAENLWLRLLWMILIGMMLGLAQTVLQITP